MTFSCVHILHFSSACLVARLVDGRRRLCRRSSNYPTHFFATASSPCDCLFIFPHFFAWALFSADIECRVQLRFRVARYIERDYFLVAIYNKPPLFARHDPRVRIIMRASDFLSVFQVAWRQGGLRKLLVDSKVSASSKHFITKRDFSLARDYFRANTATIWTITRAKKKRK